MEDGVLDDLEDGVLDDLEDGGSDGGFVGDGVQDGLEDGGELLLFLVLLLAIPTLTLWPSLLT